MSDALHKSQSADQEGYDNDASNSLDNSSRADGKNLTKKKKQYIEQEIIDKTGTFTYKEDPSQYKKARKRLQNRESAVRSRMKKKQEIEELEEKVRLLNEQKAAIASANEELKRQNQYWQDLFKNQQLQPQKSSESAEQTRSAISTHTNKDSGTDFSFDPLDLSYESLDQQRGNVMKRTKRSDSNDFHHLEDKITNF